MEVNELGAALETIMSREIRRLLRDYVHLSPDAVAKMLALSTSTIYQAIQTGELKALKSGERKGISVSLGAIDEYLQLRQVDPEAMAAKRMKSTDDAKEWLWQEQQKWKHKATG